MHFKENQQSSAGGKKANERGMQFKTKPNQLNPIKPTKSDFALLVRTNINMLVEEKLMNEESNLGTKTNHNKPNPTDHTKPTK